MTTDNRVTMYGVAKLCSAKTGTHVREQQLYNYRTKGLIKVGTDGKVSLAEAEEFAQKFADRRAERAAKKLAEVAE